MAEMANASAFISSRRGRNRGLGNQKSAPFQRLMITFLLRVTSLSSYIAMVVSIFPSGIVRNLIGSVDNGCAPGPLHWSHISYAAAGWLWQEVVSDRTEGYGWQHNEQKAQGQERGYHH